MTRTKKTVVVKAPSKKEKKGKVVVSFLEPKVEAKVVPSTIPEMVKREPHESKILQMKQPVFEGKKVLEVLSYGHTKTHWNCKALDGKTEVTLHVPKELF